MLGVDNWTWCCGIVKEYPDLIPFTTFGSFKDKEKQQQWKDKKCNDLVGGSSKTNCGKEQNVEKGNTYHVNRIKISFRIKLWVCNFEYIFVSQFFCI